MAFTVISLFTISASTKSEEEKGVAAEAGGHLLEKKEDLEDRPEDGPAERNGKTAEEAHTFEISSATIIFQALLVLSSMYYAVLCTNWGDLNLYSKDQCLPGEILVDDKCVKNEALTDTSFWLKIVT